jgi:tetratricopeptide (TPR) repeat protein
VLPASAPEQDADALFGQAQAAEETENFAEAERLYRLLMKCDPTDAAPPFNLGNMLRANGRKVEAEAALRAATRADPTFAEAWYNLSYLLDEQPVRSRHRLSVQCAASRAELRRRHVQSRAATSAKQQARGGRGVLAALPRQRRSI